MLPEPKDLTQRQRRRRQRLRRRGSDVTLTVSENNNLTFDLQRVGQGHGVQFSQ